VRVARIAPSLLIEYRFLYSMAVMLFTTCMYRVSLFPGLHMYAYIYVPRPLELAERNLLDEFVVWISNTGVTIMFRCLIAVVRHTTQ
jgi:hypothetical protein